MSGADEGTRSGHLSTTWEIAVVTIFVALVLLILGTVWFQIRRKRTRRRQELLDTEQARRESQGDAEKKNMEGPPLSTPEPVANPARHSKSSRNSGPYQEHDRPSKKPPAPRYYWDRR